MNQLAKRIQYNQNLGELEKVLTELARPGEYFARGTLTVPLPKLEIEGVGVISFPVHPAQALEIVAQATLAPYGRGEETIVDPNVRRVWQIGTDRFRIGGSAWAQTLESIVSRCAQDLGCDGGKVFAEPYKLLLYEPGGFFLSHRDTEKAPGMFGTLVIVLPSAHSGGELVVRHAGREVTIDFTGADVSEISFAAFYADCQHEVRPLTHGNRLCVVYNLLLSGTRTRAVPKAPENSTATEKAVEILSTALSSECPPKLVYLLEHEYTPEGLSFSGLKNHDRAVAAVLAGAAAQANCAIHLGIVHIEETGPAELAYYPRRRRGWSRYEEEDDEGENAEYSIIEISESLKSVSNWVTLANEKSTLPEIPLDDGELLPSGSLDNEPPDEDRVTEATGNEGATFERAYHRAAIVLWRQDRYPEVLLQRGVDAAMRHFTQLARSENQSPDALRKVAELIIARWSAGTHGFRSYRLDPAENASRAAMLAILRKIGSAGLAKEFIESVVLNEYDGSENKELVACSSLLPSAKLAPHLFEIVQRHLPALPSACIDLFSAFVRERPTKEPKTIAESLFAAMVKCLAHVKMTDPSVYYWNRPKPEPFDASALSKLMLTVVKLGEDQLHSLASAIIANPSAFSVDEVVAPAVTKVLSSESNLNSAALILLWQYAADFLLQQSEYPPVRPKDWARPVKLDCQCQCCHELTAFALNPQEQVHIFKVRQDLRHHIESTISQHRMDMKCKTEERGSPKPMVCTKNLAAYERNCARHGKHLALITNLLPLANAADRDCLKTADRLKATISRTPH
jgi:hypothetical protein